jgi:hypothetical protein
VPGTVGSTPPGSGTIPLRKKSSSEWRMSSEPSSSVVSGRNTRLSFWSRKGRHRARSISGWTYVERCQSGSRDAKNSSGTSR